MKSICLIAARGGSKGVANKNIRILGKKPLIANTIERAINSKVFDYVIVSTEDHSIANISKKYGADVPFKRPKKFATNTASMDDVVNHAMNQLELLGYKFDFLISRDCTAPFIPKSAYGGSIKLLKQNKCNLVITAYKTQLNPYFNMMEINSKGFLSFCKNPGSRIVSRQTAPIVYQLTGLYAMNVQSFKKYKKIFMPRALPYEIRPEEGLMIDTEYEFKIAQQIASNRININWN